MNKPCMKCNLTANYNALLQILMIRLGSISCVNCLVHLSWFELLLNYFQELLGEPLTQYQSDQGDVLEGSPFLLSLSNGQACGMHFSHLQRQAIFLLLACSFSLISQRGLNADNCNRSTMCSRFTTSPDSELDDFCRKKGLLELYKWIQGHLPTEISIQHGKYMEICMNFMSSFLQLFLREVCLLAFSCFLCTVVYEYDVDIFFKLFFILGNLWFLNSDPYGMFDVDDDHDFEG